MTRISARSPGDRRARAHRGFNADEGPLGCPVVVYDYDGTNSGCRHGPARVHMPHTVPSREHTRHQSQSRSRSQLHIQALSLFAARVLLPYTTPGLAFTARYTVVHTTFPSPSSESVSATDSTSPTWSVSPGPPAFDRDVHIEQSQPGIPLTASSRRVQHWSRGPGAGAPQSYYCHCIIIPTTLTVTTPGGNTRPNICVSRTRGVASAQRRR